MSKSNPKRYAQDLDFIIPFLINHSNEQENPVKKKRGSLPARGGSSHRSTKEMMRIYRPGRKGAGEREKRSVLEKEKQKELEKDRVVSQLQLALTQSPYVMNNRFYKARSVANHIPSHLPQQLPETKPSPSPEKPPDFSPIPGIRFKKRSMFHESASIITPQFTPSEELVEYRSELSNKIKAGREKKEWSKKRCANVDFIINRKCKNFNDLIAEYRRRLAIDTPNKIFIFNSKDNWLRRVLIGRGWIENQSRDSRAFHLYWSSRVYKERMFPEQLANHYRNSDVLTSKAGLHRMLMKYNLTGLQPKTFDLTLQRQEFALYYVKLSFLGKLQAVISRFEFEDAPISHDFEEIGVQLAQLRGRQGQKGYERGVIQEQLFSVVQGCLFLLQDKIDRINMFAIDHILFILHSSLALTPTEEELVRMLRDFQHLAGRDSLFQRELEQGTQNLWLTKSKTSSKGVGISLHKDYDSIARHENRLAQKYIQNPLIFKDAMVKGRKFDIRIWVLLVGNSRAKLYYHQKFYGRLCYEAYSLETINLDNEKKHLTNYSQNRHKFREEGVAESILLPEAIFQLIEREKGVDYRERFYANIQDILSKLSPIFKMEIAMGSQNSFELFGIDLLIDSALRLHLLEANLSAACEERHSGLSGMLEDMGQGMMNILQEEQGWGDLRGWRGVK